MFKSLKQRNREEEERFLKEKGKNKGKNNMTWNEHASYISDGSSNKGINSRGKLYVLSKSQIFITS